MTLIGAINHIDSIKPNSYSEQNKRRWLSTLDGLVKREIIDTHKGAEAVSFSEYTDATPLTQELLVPFPYDDVYIRWLEAQIDYANGEYGKYNNTITAFNNAYARFESYYHKNNKPLSESWTNF